MKRLEICTVQIWWKNYKKDPNANIRFEDLMKMKAALLLSTIELAFMGFIEVILI
jgi:hypothetical protein